MRRNFATFLLALGTILPAYLHAQTNFPAFDHLFLEERHYIIHKTKSEIVIDGLDHEKSWQTTQWTDYFLDIEGPGKPRPAFQTRMKMLWDDQYIYFLAEMEEPHVWAYYEEHDKIVYHENDFEIFIDPDGDTHHYFEFEFNAQNTLFDLFMTKPYRNGGIPLISWNSTGVRSAVSIDGTLNNPNDKDKKWTLEVAIPFKDLRLTIHTRTPENGEVWRINFSRVQWQTEVVDGKYKRKKHPETGRLIREDNWVWSPIGIVNMHFPERWGYLQFSEEPPGTKVEFSGPENKKIIEHLWRIYYKQQHFRHQNGRYAHTLEELDEPKTTESKNQLSVKFELLATDSQFTLIAETLEDIKLTINNNGKFRTFKNR
jgi:hypothetical protein